MHRYRWAIEPIGLLGSRNGCVSNPRSGWPPFWASDGRFLRRRCDAGRWARRRVRRLRLGAASSDRRNERTGSQGDEQSNAESLGLGCAHYRVPRRCAGRQEESTGLPGLTTALHGRVIQGWRRKRTARGRCVCAAAASRRGVAGASMIVSGATVSAGASVAGHVLTADQR
jgi:hypothetical protein